MADITSTGVAAGEGFDPARRYLRVTRRRDDGMVELDYAVGAPEVYVEMILPAAAVEDLIARERPVLLEGPRTTWTAEDVANGLADASWSLGEMQGNYRKP